MRIFFYLIKIFICSDLHYEYKMMLYLLWIDNLLAQIRGFLWAFYDATKACKGQTATIDRILSIMDFLLKIYEQALKIFRTTGLCLYLLMQDSQNCVIISISQTVLQHILQQLFPTQFENRHFFMIGIEAGKTRLVFFSKAFGKQNIDIFSIPAMSYEPKKVFSGEKNTLSDNRSSLTINNVQATQCLNSWFCSVLYTKGDINGVISAETLM